MDVKELMKNDDFKALVKQTIRDELESYKGKITQSLINIMEEEYRSLANGLANKEIKSAVQDQVVIIDSDKNGNKTLPKRDVVDL